jgi:hypothetical protein
MFQPKVKENYFIINSQTKQQSNNGYLQKANFFGFLRKSRSALQACLG